MAILSKLLSKENNIMTLIEDILPIFNATAVVGTILLCFFGFYVIKWINQDSVVRIRDHSKYHSWTSIGISSKSWYCSICENLLLSGIGFFCDSCGVCADTECIKKANTKLHCKIVTSNRDSLSHHWVKGNLPLGANCYICQEECSIEPGLIDFQCCWCQKSVHTECLDKGAKECDLGPHKKYIVPPWCVQVARRKGALRKDLLLRGVKDPRWDNWSPLVVIANKKSGNNDGQTILSEFRKYLNPIQVIDLSEQKPTSALQWCVLLAPRQIRLLVAGGDGTISWVLTTSHKLDLNPQPLLSVIPLGTGNDLSRVLQWGDGSSSDFNVPEILEKIEQGRVSQLDRWKVEVIPNRHLGLLIPTKTMYMYNYLSIGVDAQVTLDFHKTRDSFFYLFGSRIFNKMLYLCFGTQQVVTADCKNVEQRLELFMDGKKTDLPELESIVILNIPSWGAGVNLWHLSRNGSSKPQQSFHDGVLEIMGIFSSFQMAQLQMGMSTPLRIGQAKNVEIRLTHKVPIQVDGEPWEQNPAVIKITYINKCPVLINQTE